MLGTPTVVDRSSSGGQEMSAWGYRPHLDGLRAVAVYLVVAYHAGIEPLAGGFIGVDVFFVLSGYLVTQVLLQDLRGGGPIRFGRFYARRARRLLPAAAVVLVVTAAVFAAVGSPAALAEEREGVRASALYVANWFFIARSTDYFAEDVAASPVLHFWSLAVEEQFYVLWPLLLGGVVALARRAGRRAGTVVRLTIGVVAAASATAAVVIGGTDVSRAYYGTDTRAYQLLAGALLALSPGVVPALRRLPGAGTLLPTAALVSLAAVPVLALDRVGLGPIGRGLAVTLVVLVLLGSLEAAPGRLAARFLALAPLVHLGRISYGTYLWHWPVIVVLREAVDVDLGSRALAFVTVLVATGLASLSHELLESPIRRWPVLDRRALPVVAGGLALSLTVGLLVGPRILDPGATRSGRTGSGPIGGVGGVDAGGSAAAVDWAAAKDDLARYWDCADPVQGSCPIVAGDGLHILLMGDSYANSLVPAFAEVAESRGLRLSAAVLAGCPWQPNIRYGVFAEQCEAVKALWYGAMIDELDPDIVVVANRPIDDPVADPLLIHDADEGDLLPLSEPLFDALETRTAEASSAFVADGRRVVFVEPIPGVPKEVDPIACLSEAESVAECRFVAATEPTRVESLYRRFADEDGAVWSVDLDRVFCPYLPICDAVIDGTVVRRDRDHVTVSYAEAVGDDLADHLDGLGILR